MFGYDEAIIERFPAIRAGLVHATGLNNGPSPPGLLDEYRAQQQVTMAEFSGSPVAEMPSISAWRRVFTDFGVKPTQHRVAVEALLRRLLKHGDVPSIGTLVDLGNMVSIRYAVPVAVFDRAGVAGDITVRFATGEERFLQLGSTEPVAPTPAEVVFVDENDEVSARRWCWRQGARAATSDATTEAMFVAEAHHGEAEQDVEAAVDDLCRLLGRYLPSAQVSSYLLTPAHPRVGEAR